MPSKFTEREQKIIARSYAMSRDFAYEVANRNGISPETVRNYCKKFNISGRTGQSWAQKEKKLRRLEKIRDSGKGKIIVQMSDSGYTQKEIADAVSGITKAQVRSYLKWQGKNKDPSEIRKLKYNSPNNPIGKKRIKEIREVGREYAKRRGDVTLRKLSNILDKPKSTIRKYLHSEHNPYPYPIKSGDNS
jgi:DNA-binding CsgD family transcriptional regulator